LLTLTFVAKRSGRRRHAAAPSGFINGGCRTRGSNNNQNHIITSVDVSLSFAFCIQ
jgi:hypothetical protein